jgi:hypothetical protein
MALTARKNPDAMIFALVAAHNAAQRAYTLNETTYPHADITSVPGGDYTAPTSTAVANAAAAATTLGTTLTSANESKRIANLHMADALAHEAADADHLISSPDATDQTTANTLLNELKTDLNLHFLDADSHYTADATNVVDAADATDAGSSQTLADDIKAKLNAHILFSSTAPMLDIVPA